VRRSCDVPAGSNFHYISEWQIFSEWRNLQGYEFVVLAAVQWRPQPLQKTEHSACRHTSAVSSLFWSSRTALCFWGCLQTPVHIITQRSRHNVCRTDFIFKEANLKFTTRQQLERALQSEDLVCPNVQPAGSCQTNPFYITFLHNYVKFKKH